MSDPLRRTHAVRLPDGRTLPAHFIGIDRDGSVLIRNPGRGAVPVDALGRPARVETDTNGNWIER